MGDKNQIKLGALISYILIIGNALFGLLVTPFVLKELGSSSYGVYKTVGSLSSALLVLDLGIGGTLMRYIASYRAKSQDEKIAPFVSMMLCESACLIGIIILVEAILYFRLDAIYSASFSASELILTKRIYLILAISIVFNIVENFLNGIISGYNNFIIGNGMKLLKLIARIALIFILLPITGSALVLVGITLFLSIAGAIFQLVYIICKYPIKLKLKPQLWEIHIFKESFGYTILTFLTVLSAQVNSNLDNVIVGSFCGADAVAVYSFGLVIFGMFEQLSTSISSVVLPTVSKIVVRENWRREAQEFVIKTGRIQFMLLAAAVVGFAVLGKEFIRLWLGEGFFDVYIIVLILMIPALFELCVNVCLAVLRAKNMLGFRTTILVLSTILNLIVSVLGIHRFGYFSAAIGTATSFTVGSLIVMNIYYKKKFNFNMLRIYKNIMGKTWLCLLISGAAIMISSRFISGSWIAFVANVLIFCVVYGSSLLLWGFTAAEKDQVKNVVKKIIKKHN